ncbi:MAG: hypothetical protein ACRDQ6_20855, partial [Pseudonocardiaceae bacterium]
VMATRGMFSTTDLLAPLAQRGISLSSSQVYRLVVDRPERGGRRRRPGQTTQAPMPWRSGPRSSPTADPQRLGSLGICSSRWQGGGHDDLAAGVHRVQQAAADSAAARRGLVLRCLRPHPATVRELQ